ncbi:MAG: type II toxin-antitoxin system RelE/ParE family toxin [Nitrospinota bacterium]
MPSQLYPQRPGDFKLRKENRRVKNALRKEGARRKEEYEEAISSIRRNPFRHPSNPLGINHLKGSWLCLWRFKLGRYRIIYEVDSESREFEILYYGPRGGLYS